MISPKDKTLYNRNQYNQSIIINMKKRTAILALLLSLGVGSAMAQTEGRSFYIDFGQNNVANQGYTTDVDANGHKWNNIHGKGTGAPDKAYALTSTDLVSADGAASGYKVQIGTTFSTNGYSNGGLQSPKASLLGDLAVESATQDYIFMEGGQDYGIVRFKGLDQTKGYRFYSFGSRTDTGTPGRVATFEFRGLNRWQGDHAMGAKSLGDGGYNGNNNNVQESGIIFPDANGVIEMTIIKKTKSGMVHLNAMKMVEIEGATHPFQKYTLSRKMYFDFGENGKAGNRGDITSSPDANGNYWNNLSCETSGNSVAAGKKVNVVTSDNKSTSIVLTNQVAFNANGYNNGGLKTPSADNLGDLAVVGATQDYIYTENKGVATMLFSGLDKTKKYRFHIFGTRTDNSGIRSTVLRVNGRNEWMSVQTTSGPNTGGEGVNQNVANVSVSDFISPDEVGNIIFTFRQNNAPSCSFGHVSIVKLEEWNTNGAVDEAPAIAGDQKFYIDFGEYDNDGRGNLTVGPDANGNYWTNAYSSPVEKMYPRSFQLVNSKNEASGYTLSFGTYFHTNGMSGGGGLLEPSASLLGDLAVATATQDYIHMEGAQDYSVIHFRGLDPAKAYRFSSFGHRNADDARAGYFTFTGQNTWTGEMQMTGAGIGEGGYNGNNNKILVSDPIFPDANGNIDLTMSKKYSGGMVYLNCMKVEEISGLARPYQQLTLAQKMYFDFGETANASRGHQTTGADKNGNYWNNITSGNSGSNKIDAGKEFALVNSNNESTGAKLVNVYAQYTNGVNAGGNNAPDASTLYDLAIQTATEDYMFIDNGDLRPFRITGLDKNHCYRLYIYGTRNHTDNRCTSYVIEGQTTWTGGQSTSGYDLGGYGNPGNINNILVTDYLYPSRTGELVINFQRIAGMAHISAMKIEEYSGGTRPEEPLDFTELRLSGNAEDVTFQGVGGGKFQAYARLQKGTYRLSGTTEDGDVDLTDAGDGHFATEGGSATFTATGDCVARITVDAAAQTVEILPVKMNVRGNIAAGNPEIAYKGNGVWESQVTLQETASQQWVDKTMYFAFNNDDNLAIRRLKNASTRYALGMASNGQDVENIYQNAGTYTITVDMNNNVYGIDAPIDENRISVFGSSVANGQGATDYMGYRYLYGQHLIQRYENGESEYPLYTSNVAIGGNTTINLLNRYDDLIRDFGRYVIFGLSLGNEGIHGASNQEAIFAQWRDNMLKLIKMVREDGKIPVVMNNYTRGDYNSSDYDYVKRLNLLIHEWDVPSFNCLGSIDNGAGLWADGYVSDTYHQNNAGHYEFFYSMVPSLFDALKAGKAMPVRNTAASMTIPEGKSVRFAPEGTVHPFTLSVRLKGTVGEAVSIACSGGEARIEVTADGKVKFTSPTGATLTSSAAVNDGNWHYVTLTSYYAQKRTILYVDKAATTVLAERMGEIREICVGKAEREVSEVAFWRSGMTPEEISAHCDGRMLKSSLEVYAPLTGADAIQNLAQSTNTLSLTTAMNGKLVKSQGNDVRFISESGNGGFSGNENFPKLFDGTTAKWCLNVGSGVHVIFHASKPVRLSGYKITTGADCAQWTGRNPQSWKLYGSTAAAGINENDPSWELITEVANDNVLQDLNSVTYTYNLPTPTAKAYTTFKWVITARRGGGEGVIQVEEFTPIVLDAQPAKPVTVVCDEGTKGWGDEVEKIFDDNLSTKWNCWLQDGQAYAICHTSEPIRINGYEITTGNDNATYNGRNPKTWTLFGTNADSKPSADDPSWEPLYKVADDNVLQDLNMQTYQYMGQPTRKAYNYYKWVVTATQGSMLQVGEFNLYAYESASMGDADQLHVSAAGYATYVTPFPADFTLTSDLQAFTVSEVNAGTEFAILSEVERVPAGTAVVVKAAEGDYTIHATTEAAELTSANLLLAATENTLVPAEQQYYVIAQNEGVVGFYPARQGTYIPYGRAYLFIPGGSMARVFRFDADDVDAIRGVSSSSEAGRAYDLQGRKVDASRLQPSIYVMDGRKVAVK